jgi:hypothetical protein
VQPRKTSHAAGESTWAEMRAHGGAREACWSGAAVEIRGASGTAGPEASPDAERRRWAADFGSKAARGLKGVSAYGS